MNRKISVKLYQTVLLKKQSAFKLIQLLFVCNIKELNNIRKYLLPDKRLETVLITCYAYINVHVLTPFVYTFYTYKLYCFRW